MQAYSHGHTYSQSTMQFHSQGPKKMCTYSTCPCWCLLFPLEGVRQPPKRDDFSDLLNVQGFSKPDKGPRTLKDMKKESDIEGVIDPDRARVCNNDTPHTQAFPHFFVNTWHTYSSFLVCGPTAYYSISSIIRVHVHSRQKRIGHVVTVSLAGKA